MNTLMTRHEFETEEARLQEAVRRATDDAGHAAYRERTKTGSAQEAKKAKDHLTAVKTELDDLRSAWSGSQQEAVRQKADARRESFCNATVAIHGHLDDRESAVAEVLDGLRAVLAGFEKYDAATIAIRRRSPRPISSALDMSPAHIMQTVGSVIVNSGRFEFLKRGTMNLSKAEADPVAHEKGHSDRVRHALRAMAPQEQEA